MRNSQINPYRSVRGGCPPLNRVAVLISPLPAPAALLDKKKLPKFCLLSNTVGGLDSSGTIEANSTEGGGISSEGEVALLAAL